MLIKAWWKFSVELEKELEDLIIWKLHELKIFSFAFNTKIAEKEKFLLDIWLPKEKWNKEKRILLEGKLSDFLKEKYLTNLSFSWDLIKEEDWTEAWKEYWGPSQVGNNLVVLPCWMELPKEFCNKLVIKIDPGAAFGTGSHPSTSLCLEQIELNEFDKKKILDVGSGSGILTIASKLLGAKSLYALDSDYLACNSTAENFILNFGSMTDLKIYEGEFLELLKEYTFSNFDYILCNILAEVILKIIPYLNSVLSKEGKLILSGIINSQKDEIIKLLNLNNFEVVDVSSKNDWICIVARQIP